jgi:hypothetical protein
MGTNAKGDGVPVTVWLDRATVERTNKHRIPDNPGARIPSFSEVVRRGLSRGLDEIERDRAGADASKSAA